MFELELETFFSRAFERFLNEKLFLRDYQLDRKKMEEYTDKLVSIPISAYLDYMVAHIFPSPVLPQDIVQFSSLEDATTRICSKIAESGDEGLRYGEIGKLLLSNDKERKRGALVKYGENHAKTALEFGLVQNICDYNYLSCIGVVINDYAPNKQNALLKRLILRNRLIQRLSILSQKGYVSLENEMGCISETTIKRRKSNIRTLFSLFDIEEAHYFYNIQGLGLTIAPELFYGNVADMGSDSMKKSDSI